MKLEIWPPGHITQDEEQYLEWANLLERLIECATRTDR